MSETHTDIALNVERTADIVAAYVAHNAVPATDLSGLIATVHAALAGLAGATGAASAASLAPAVEQPSPAQVRKSVGQDGIVSFIDGRSYKTLKRHLTAHGLTPERYRERYGLPVDYGLMSWLMDMGAAAKTNALARLAEIEFAGRRALTDPPETDTGSAGGGHAE